MNRPCPACPDGNEWDETGLTGRACPVCQGRAYLGEDEDEPPKEKQHEQLD